MLRALALGIVLTPAAALAADAAVPGLGTGVYAMAGAFFGQLATATIAKRHAREATSQHEVRCRAYRPPRSSRPDLE